MNIPIIPKKQGRLKQACNWAFHKSKGRFSEEIKESHRYDKALAFIF